MTFLPTQWVDVNPFLLKEIQPVVTLPRNPNEQQAVYVPVTSLLVEGPTEYAFTQIGSFVRVPIVAYKTTHLALPDIFGLGVQLGIAAVDKLRTQHDKTPKNVQLVIGHQCTDLRPGEEAFRCYIGIALFV